MPSKRRPFGHLLIDHRAGPGLNCVGLGGGTLFETDMATCSHCQRGVVLNPLRMRERAYCPQCDHYICDECESVRVATGICKPFKQIMDEVCERALRVKTGINALLFDFKGE